MQSAGVEWIGSVVMGSVALLLFALALVFGFIGWRALSSVRRSAGFVRVPAQVLAAGTKESVTTNAQGTMTRTHVPYVRYAYAWDGQRYESERRQFGQEMGFGSRSFAAKRVATYPVGSTVEAFVDPAEPSQAVLERASASGWVLVGVAALLGVVGLGLVAIAVVMAM